MDEQGVEVSYTIGTMIELPRAALTADEIAKEAEFFSFGTNDLTQTTFGFSRDDVEGKFLPYYLDNNILEKNPFCSPRSGRRRPAGQDRVGARPQHPSESQDRHLRRARRRTLLCGLLPPGRARLRQLLTLQSANCTPWQPRQN